MSERGGGAGSEGFEEAVVEAEIVELENIIRTLTDTNKSPAMAVIGLQDIVARKRSACETAMRGGEGDERPACTCPDDDNALHKVNCPEYLWKQRVGPEVYSKSAAPAMKRDQSECTPFAEDDYCQALEKKCFADGINAAANLYEDISDWRREDIAKVIRSLKPTPDVAGAMKRDQLDSPKGTCAIHGEYDGPSCPHTVESPRVDTQRQAESAAIAPERERVLKIRAAEAEQTAQHIRYWWGNAGLDLEDELRRMLARVAAATAATPTEPPTVPHISEYPYCRTCGSPAPTHNSGCATAPNGTLVGGDE